MNCSQLLGSRSKEANSQEQFANAVMAEYQRLAEENKQLHQLIKTLNQAVINATHNLRSPLTSILLSIPMIERYFSENPLTKGPKQLVIRNLANITRITKHINDILVHLLEVQEAVNDSVETKQSKNNSEHIDNMLAHLLEVQRLVNQHEKKITPQSNLWQSRQINSTNTKKIKPETLVPLKLHIQSIEFAPLIRLLVEEYRSRAMLKHITIKYEERLTRNIVLLTDQRALTEIIENLLSNAIKYSYPHSAVLVKLVEYKRQFSESIIRLVIEDTGEGMSSEEVQRIFEPQAHISTRPTAGEASYGIGLSIAKRYADAMSFMLICRSHRGAGTQFILEKPLHSSPSSNKKPS